MVCQFPLWQNKNTIKTEKANLISSDFKLLSTGTNTITKTNSFMKMSKLTVEPERIQKVLTDLEQSELLDKALALGQISFIEYSLETSNYYESYNRYLMLEKEY